MKFLGKEDTKEPQKDEIFDDIKNKDEDYSVGEHGILNNNYFSPLKLKGMNKEERKQAIL